MLCCVVLCCVVLCCVVLCCVVLCCVVLCCVVLCCVVLCCVVLCCLSDVVSPSHCPNSPTDLIQLCRTGPFFYSLTRGASE